MVNITFKSSTLRIAKAQADIERLQEQLRNEHDATGAAELARAHARLSAAGGVNGTAAAAH